jgi:hypothetical protein
MAPQFSSSLFPPYPVYTPGTITRITSLYADPLFLHYTFLGKQISRLDPACYIFCTCVWEV